MGKLQEALREAEQENAATKLKEKGEELAEKKVKKEVGKQAKVAGGKAASAAQSGAQAAHAALLAKSELYAKAAGGAQKAGAAIKAGGKGIIGLIKGLVMTPIPGWIIIGLVVVLIINLGKSGKLDDIDAGYLDGGSAETERLGDDDEIWMYETECPVYEYEERLDDGEFDDGDWTKQGLVGIGRTRANRNAEAVFRYWTNAGLSDEAAAGIVGWVATEGGFSMWGRAEGFHGVDKVADGSIMFNHEPVPSGTYDVGGGGVYQFTPYTDYAPLGSPDWENPGKMHQYIFDLIGNKNDWNPDHDLTGRNLSFEQFAQLTNAQEAALAWNAFERADTSTVDEGEKKADAQKAYEMFAKGAKFDPAKYERHFGALSGEYDSVASEAIYDPCRREAGMSWRGEGGQPAGITSGSWVHPAMHPGLSGLFSRERLPNVLKEYAIDPESVGMYFNDRDSWPHRWATSGGSDGGQCTHLTANLAAAIWEKPNGEKLINLAGNGSQVAGNIAAKYGGQVSDVPRGGAIFSTPSGSAMCGAVKCGHTGIVSHVFDNGDFLIIEQNLRNLSGDANSTPFTWNYRYIQKEIIYTESWSFFDPTTVGFQLVPGITSL